MCMKCGGVTHSANDTPIWNLCTCQAWPEYTIEKTYAQACLIIDSLRDDMLSKLSASQAQMAERPIEAREAPGSTPGAGTP